MVDLDKETGRMAVSGRTFDRTLSGGAQLNPENQIFVSLYGGPLMERLWLTVVKVNQHGQLISFSSDGQYIAVYGSGVTNKPRCIVLLSSDTGTVIKAFSYSGMAGSLNFRYRSI